MPKRLHRLLLVVSALIFAFAACLHTSAFGKARAVLDGVALPPFYAHSFEALWLIDSATLLALAILFVAIAARPSLATRWVILLLALIPASTAILVFIFVGSFPPPYILGLAVLDRCRPLRRRGLDKAPVLHILIRRDRGTARRAGVVQLGVSTPGERNPKLARPRTA